MPYRRFATPPLGTGTAPHGCRRGSTRRLPATSALWPHWSIVVTRPVRPRPAVWLRRWAARLAVGSLLLLGVAFPGCSTGSAGTPGGISDEASSNVTQARPPWFPAQFPGPPGGVIVEVIDEPDTDNAAISFGRSVTWRVDRSYDAVLEDIDAILASQGWTPTDRLATTGEEDTRRTSIYLENGTLEVIRVYTDANLDGVRVTVELPV